MPPAVGDLLAEDLTIRLVQLGNVLNSVGALSNQRSLAKEGKNVGELIFSGVSFNVLKQLFSWDANKRIADPIRSVNEADSDAVFRENSLSRSVSCQLGDTGLSLGLVSEEDASPPTPSCDGILEGRHCCRKGCGSLSRAIKVAEGDDVRGGRSATTEELKPEKEQGLSNPSR